MRSFGDFHKPFLNELRRSRHGVSLDLYSGKQICVSPSAKALMALMQRLCKLFPDGYVTAAHLRTLQRRVSCGATGRSND